MYFKGVYTAIVTPFTANGEVDYPKLEELVEFNIAGGVAGLVPVGTTGESPTGRVEIETGQAVTMSVKSTPDNTCR